MSRFTGLLKLAAAAAAGAVLAGGATAVANTDDAARHRGHEPANIGRVKLDVKAYYGDVVGSDGKHRYSDDSRFVSDTERQVEDAKRHLTRRLDRGVVNPAIVLDVDDTSEVTYGWEADNDFGFDPKKQQEAIDKGTFVANKPVLELTNWAAQRGVKIYFLTGRNEFQGPQSLKNLANEGFPAPAGAFFKPKTTAPDYLPCGLTCTTVQYKAGTRKHIASTGATIVLNFGDQFSDLEGGYAEFPVKLPNPMYYLP
ncbi:HAD family acid phosphatase [Amycolatopsis regifaucium]|uniref:Acid phosphatase n=1 Tax=Amycolatopsis regifaucium TaxID=546365 RepID=A0A154MAD6_9PSEU|nr:HAD family acid phosphatase [Amycolatopsis regifaucium]KZB81571.1 acid phosphatase [Amycolatopsis regifaucium]OKA06858.1 acid phosphatase [Amycolatopsis regifaucium]SFH28194.1 HAD superfamily, subfamily IIIB (Acid phosphatase) [Amycolatopsis regifaucium]